MSGHCHDDWGCHGWHHYPRPYGPRWRHCEEPAPEDEREYLDGEKRILEGRLKELEARTAEAGK